MVLRITLSVEVSPAGPPASDGVETRPIPRIDDGPTAESLNAPDKGWRQLVFPWFEDDRGCVMDG